MKAKKQVPIKPQAAPVKPVYPAYPYKHWWIAGIALAGVLLYFQTIHFGFTLDDGLYAYDNSLTKQGLKNWPDIFRYGTLKFSGTEATNTGTYRPITLLSFAIEQEIFGDFYPKVGHGINLILYFFCLLFSGLLLFAWFNRMRLPIWVPTLSLLLFAVHPIHTEVVASIKSRDTLLAATLGLAALWLWYRNFPRDGILKNIAIGSLFFLSLLSKEETITFVLLVPLIGVSLQGKSIRETMRQYIPIIIPAFTYLILRNIILDPSDPSRESIINNVIYATNTQQRLATNFYIYLYYIKLLFFPYPLSWDYSFNQIPIVDFSNPWVWISIFFFAWVLFYIIKNLNRKENVWVLGFAGYLITFSIFSNLHPAITIGATLAERFLFIPSLFFCIVLAFGIFVLIKKTATIYFRIPLFVLLGLITFSFLFYSVKRSLVWENNTTLYQSGVKTSPDSWRAQMFLGIQFMANAYRCRDQGKTDSALYYTQQGVGQYEKGFAIIGSRAALPQYHLNLADAYAIVGDTIKAIETASKIKSGAKNYSKALFKLGYWSYQLGNYDDAARYYEMMVQEGDEEIFKAYKNLGLSYLRIGKNADAIEQLEKALEIAGPGDDTTNLRAEIARLVVQTGDRDKLEKIISSTPDIAPMVDRTLVLEHLKKGNAFYQARDYANAKVSFKNAETGFANAQVSTQFPKYYEAYAHSCILTGDTVNSKRLFLKALEVSPPNAFIYRNLGTIAFFREKNYPMAEQYFRKGIAAGTDRPLDDYRNLGSSLLIQGKKQEAINAFEKALTYGKDMQVVKNLYLLYKEIGNAEKAGYYQGMLK